MWNRGTYRGWGFGRVSKLTPRIVKLETPHLGTIQWERSDFQEDIQEGRVFFIDLDQIIRALMEQLARLEDTYTSEQDKERAYLVEETQERLGQALFLLEKLKNLGC